MPIEEVGNLQLLTDRLLEEMKRDALHKLSDSDKSLFKEDVAFKYADDEEVLKRLCGLK